MEALTVKELYTLDETIAKDIFDGVTYPWEVLPKISSFILKLGETLSSEEYEKRGYGRIHKTILSLRGRVSTGTISAISDRR